MKRNARPGDALHVRHIGIIVEVRIVLCFLLDNAEYPRRRLASLLTTRHRRSQNPAVGVVNRYPLIAKRNNRHDWLAGATCLNGIDRAFATIAAGARMISQRDQRRQSGRDKTRGSVLYPPALRAHETRRHVRPVYCPDSDVRIITRHTRF